MTLVASLPMYEVPQTRAYWDTLWGHFSVALRDHGFDAPDTLCRPRTLDAHWRDPDLLLSQSCGLPYRTGLTDVADVVGTFDFGLEGCLPGHYRSVLVMRAGQTQPLDTALRGRLAINGHDSQSGAHVLAVMGADLARAVVTGAHVNSIRAVAAGAADLAAIDAQTWVIAQRTVPEAAELEVVHRTVPTPGLPLITARGRDGSAVFAALCDGFDTCPPMVLQSLDIRALVPLTTADFLRSDAF